MGGLLDLLQGQFGGQDEPKPRKKVKTPPEYGGSSLYDTPIDLVPKIERKELPAIPGEATKVRERKKLQEEIITETTPINSLSFRNLLGTEQERLLQLEEQLKDLVKNFAVNRSKIQSLLLSEYNALQLESKGGNISEQDMNILKFFHYITFEYYASYMGADPAKTYWRTRPSRVDNTFLNNAWFGNVGLKREYLEYPYVDKRIGAPKDLYSSTLYQDIFKSLTQGKTVQKYGVSLNTDTYFSGGNVTLVVKDATGKNVQLIYRNWKLYIATYISPGAGNNTPRGIFMLKDHVTTDFVYTDDKGDLMPTAIRLYPGKVVNGKLTFELDQGFRSHGNPVSKKGHQYGITGENISSGCFRTPGIAQWLNFYVTLQDTETYLIYDDTIRLASPGKTDFSTVLVEDIESLDFENLYSQNQNLHGQQELNFIADFFGVNPDDKKALIQAIAKTQQELKLSSSLGLLSTATMEQLYTSKFFAKNGKYAEIRTKIDTLLASTNQENEIQTYIREVFSSYPLDIAVSIVRYISYRYYFGNTKVKNSFTKESFFGGVESASKYFSLINGSSQDEKIFLDYRIIGTFPSLGQITDKLGLGIEVLSQDAVCFVFKESVYTNNFVMATYKNGKLLALHYIKPNTISENFSIGDEVYKKLASKGNIPYLYSQYLSAHLNVGTSVYYYPQTTFVD